jgi:hypothetical protein
MREFCTDCAEGASGGFANFRAYCDTWCVSPFACQWRLKVRPRRRFDAQECDPHVVLHLATPAPDFRDLIAEAGAVKAVNARAKFKSGFAGACNYTLTDAVNGTAIPIKFWLFGTGTRFSARYAVGSTVLNARPTLLWEICSPLRNRPLAEPWQRN